MYEESSLSKSRLNQLSFLFDQPPYEEPEPCEVPYIRVPYGAPHIGAPHIRAPYRAPHDPYIFKNIESVCQRQPEVYTISDTSNHYKYETQIVSMLIKLLLHITLISVFETLFYFLYVSSLENNGIKYTINTFINGVIEDCYNMTVEQIEVIDNILKTYINVSVVIKKGNTEELVRYKYNNHISNIAWGYVSGLSGLFIILSVYTRMRKIKINWKHVVLENFAMVILLGLYELLFFNTIVHKYQPISTDELSRDAVKKLQTACRVLT
jgi:hypothetical protein